MRGTIAGGNFPLKAVVKVRLQFPLDLTIINSLFSWADLLCGLAYMTGTKTVCFFQVFLPRVNHILFLSVEVIASKELQAHVFSMGFFEKV